VIPLFEESRKTALRMAANAGNATSHLSDLHKTQVLNFMKFFKSKTDQHLKEVETSFTDTKDMRLLEEMYSHDEVLNIVNGLRDLVKSNLRTELEKFAQQTALYLRLLFLQAEGQSVNLKVDTSQLDDEVLLAGIKQLQADSERKVDLPTPAAKKLTALSGTVDVKLVTQIKDLEEANSRVQDRFSKLQEQHKASLAENSQLKEAKAELQKQIEQLRRDINSVKAGNISAQLAELDQLRKQSSQGDKAKQDAIDAMAKELKEKDVQLAAKVKETAQFRELTKTLQQKNEQIKELRKQLEAAGLGPKE